MHPFEVIQPSSTSASTTELRPSQQQETPQVMVQQHNQVRLVAPCDMQAGYTFLATTNDGRSCRVTVPQGGVAQGQAFSVPFGSLVDLVAANAESSLQTESTPFFLNGKAVQSDRAEMGKWKDGLFDCFVPGVCHPSFWNALICPQILMAQVMTRLQLDWLGNSEADRDARKRTFWIVVALVIAYSLLAPLLRPREATWFQDPQTQKVFRVPTPPAPYLQVASYNLLWWSFFLYSTLVLARVRQRIRKTYQIPTVYCASEAGGALEDGALAAACTCCVVSQLARQTCDYQQQPAACCSTTGLGAGTRIDTTTLQQQLPVVMGV